MERTDGRDRLVDGLIDEKDRLIDGFTDRKDD